MKKLITKTALLITALVIFGNQTGFAKTNNSYTKNQMTKPVKDTPYLAMVTIVRTGALDTPYLKITIFPFSVYNQILTALLNQTGLFKVNILFINRKEEIIQEEEYLIDQQ